MLECYRPGPIQLEQRQEPSDDLNGLGAIGHQFGERRPVPDSPALEEPQQSLGLLGHRHPGHVQVVGGHHRNRARGERRRSDLSETLRVDTDHHLGQQFGELFLQGHRPRITAQRSGLQFGEHPRHMLVGPVLQQAREQQVTHLQQSEVLLIGHLAGRQQAGCFEVEQGGGDDQERRGLVEFHHPADLAGVGDELVGHRVQGDFGDIEAVGEYQLQQQVERTLEVAQRDVETLIGTLLGTDLRCDLCAHLPKRSMTSRANAR